MNNLRLYTFVAGLYLSELQKGLQTAHVVGDMRNDFNEHKYFDTWCSVDKTIVICSAGNHAGVVDAYIKLAPLASALNLPCSIFHEDEQSMNGMATACGIILPEEFYDVKLRDPAIGVFRAYNRIEENGSLTEYIEGTPEFELISLVKSYRLA